MKSDFLRRIVSALSDGSQRDLDQLARSIIDAERRTGHSKVADQLQSILNKSRSTRNGVSSRTNESRTVTELPLSRRHGELLTTLIPRAALEHHMVLPRQTEERFTRIEREFAARERLATYGLKPRKTILLYGAPGCGKSLGAKRLAWNTGLPLMKVRFDTLISSYFGESASNLKAIFDTAKEHPCVLLLDECDFIARSRVTSKDIGEASRIVNSLLQLMEEYDAPGLLVATTNIETSLDHALFRRFDDVFQIPMPGQSEVERLLHMALSAIRVAEIEWERVAAAMCGFSAANVVKAAQDAAKAAVLSGHPAVTEVDLKNSINDLRCSNLQNQE